MFLVQFHALFAELAGLFFSDTMLDFLGPSMSLFSDIWSNLE